MTFFKLLTFCIFMLTVIAPYTSYADTEETGYVVPEVSTALTSSTVTSGIVSTAATETKAPKETKNGVAYDPISRTPPCAGINSTCITAQTVANAKHAFVQDSPVKSYISLLSPPDGEGQECQAPTKTGLTVHRLVVEGEVAYIDKYNDAFCINQGCVYFGFIGDERCE